MSLNTLLLASGSPRRRELMSWIGLDFDVLSVDVNEDPSRGEPPDAYVSRLAEEKARKAAKLLKKNRIVLGLDTTVADENEILGKPSSPEDAYKMLERLRSRTHHVYTALAVISDGRAGIVIELCKSRVPMRHYSHEEMVEYISSGDSLDKAGAYAIQNPDFSPVIHFEGCFANVMGLPLCHMGRILRGIGVSLKVNIARVCQANLNYTCPIYQDVLDGEDVG
ncbi:MAG: Maf family protein [Anaerolineaceae bacterium]|nr:Maf family protein [Anaerolineaceae bacterium]